MHVSTVHRNRSHGGHFTGGWCNRNDWRRRLPQPHIIKDGADIGTTSGWRDRNDWGSGCVQPHIINDGANVGAIIHVDIHVGTAAMFLTCQR